MLQFKMDDISFRNTKDLRETKSKSFGFSGHLSDI